jgi:hypothetical protein
VQLERFRELPLAELGASEDALDGPFLLPSGQFALLFSLRGKGGGAMPSPSELRWHRDLPPAAKVAPVHLFLRRGDRALYLGAAELLKRGRPATDGYKLALGLAEPLEEEHWRQLVAQAQLALPPPAEEAIASLTKGSTTEHRLAAMSVFVERWYGPASTSFMTELLPRPLRALHEATAGHRVFVQNRLVSPEGLVPDGEDGRLIFYVESQGVWTWATDPAGEDPPVYVRSNAPGAWQKESDSLADFLIQVLLLEATFGAPFGASHDGLDARGLAKLTKKVKPLSIPSWSSSKTRFFASSGVIGFAAPQGPETAVWVGAKERERLEPLEALLEDWSDVRV